jgi:hypothetical protein
VKRNNKDPKVKDTLNLLTKEKAQVMPHVDESDKDRPFRHATDPTTKQRLPKIIQGLMKLVYDNALDYRHFIFVSNDASLRQLGRQQQILCLSPLGLSAFLREAFGDKPLNLDALSKI